MDKFMDSKWFMRIVAMLLAVLLYTSVNFDEQEITRRNGFTQQRDTETIQNVPVEVHYDEENLVVTGVPHTVNVIVEGPKSIVQSTKALRDFTVFVDLADAQIGNQIVRMEHQNISDKLKVKIDPSQIEVSVQEKVTKEFKVDAEINKNVVAKGYETDSPIVEPATVNVTGAKDVIEKISFVKATLNVNGEMKNTFTREAKVQVLDRDLNKLDVVVEPQSVRLKVPVRSLSKKIPLGIKETGLPKEGYQIKNITFNPKELILFGNEEALNKLDNIQVEVDVNNIDKDTDLEIPISLPNGIYKTEPEKMTVKVEVVKTEVEDPIETRTLSNLAIHGLGVTDDFELQFVQPADGKVDMEASGLSELVKGLQPEQIEIFFNAAGLELGEHEVDLQVKAPNGISWKLSENKAKIRLIEKESSSA
ncbi:CdaR family protein [Bacillus chungangensis]|uniref:YbbR domain-containing protein n=1 Tax=Bacillus chungangensis TaxID=587633 RepID=A0ABT9WXG5_9BACI|nr:CdaR family protein [Bacillus chungangensis]MDQ0177814.1 YbbR domain-containing protein [Bacillus chungangensis]